MTSSPLLKSHTILYVLGVVMLSIATLIAVVLISVLRPMQNNASVIATLTGITSPVILTLLAAAVHQVYLGMNSMKDELVQATRQAALAEGHVGGMADQRALDSVPRLRRATDGTDKERTDSHG